MLEEFQTISVDGLLATVVHVHTDWAYEIEYHDGRERRVVTRDLDPGQEGGKAVAGAADIMTGLHV